MKRPGASSPQLDGFAQERRSDQIVCAALHNVGLDGLASQLASADDWTLRLLGGTNPEPPSC
jgi:ABC-type uncharacterized transport system fused permease/ATPase subunit